MTHRSARSCALAPLTFALAALAACSGGSSGVLTPSGGGGTCPLAPAMPLRVVQLTPAANAQYVSVATTIGIRFNTCLNLATVTSTSVTLTRITGSYGPVPFTTSYDPSTATLVLDPAANLAPDATYQVTVLYTVLGAAGEPMSGTYSASFHTRATPDVTPPTTTASPGGSRYQTPQLVSLACNDGADGSGCLRTHYTVNGSTPTTASPVYSTPIPVNQDLTIRFFSVDVDGNQEAPQYASYVIDTVPPAISWIDPVNLATAVPRNVRIRARFSEEMAVGSMNATTITLTPSIDHTYAWDGDTDTLTIAPRRRLECGTTYTVTFGTGVQDVAGNALVAPVSSSFTVHTDCDEPATTASVQDGVYLAPQSVTLTCSDGAGTGCARIVYTLDGSVPTFEPPNGTVVNGASAPGITIGVGDTVLRFHAEDVAGNREPVREERYSVSTTGFTYVATSGGLARGTGPTPERFVSLAGSGVVNAFFRDASNGRLYRGTARGLYASDDGVSWSRTTFLDDLGYTSPQVTAVYAQGSLVFVGTSAGLYRSRDGGATFEHLEGGRSNPPWITDIHGDGTHVYVAGNAGLRVSHDRGDTFTEGSMATRFDDVHVEHATGLVFVACSEGLWVGSVTGGGYRVFDTTGTMPSNSVRAVAVTDGSVYAATSLGLAIFGRGSDGYPTGSPTVRTSANGLGFDDGVVEVAVSGNKIFAITTAGYPPSLHVSTNGGASFLPLPITSPDSSGTRSHASLYVDGANVYVGAPPGWFLSTDGGATFTQKDLPSVVRVLGSGSTLYAAASSGATGDDGVLVSTDGFRTFTGRGERDGMGSGGARVNDLVVDGTNLYAATGAGLAISTDGGSTWSLKNNTSNGLWALSVECVAVQPGKIWACSSNSLDLSTNGGTMFKSSFWTSGGLPNAVLASGSDVYYANTSELRLSNDGGTNFAVASSFPYRPQDLALAGSNLYVATETGTYVSADHGATFSALPAAGTSWTYSVDASAGVLYVGIDSKLGISVDGGQTFTWRDSAQGMPGRPYDTWYQP